MLGSAESQLLLQSRIDIADVSVVISMFPAVARRHCNTKMSSPANLLAGSPRKATADPRFNLIRTRIPSAAFR
jgi:hypothetical protein